MRTETTTRRRTGAGRLLRRLAAAATAALALTTLVAVAPARAADPGTIVVDVTGSDTGRAVVGVCADVFEEGTEFGAFDCIDEGETGPLVITGLTDGVTYQLAVTVPPSTGYFGIGFPFRRPVTAPADLAFTLERGALVQGSLSYTDGTVPDFARVFLYPQDLSLSNAFTFAGRDGWSTVVQPGDYKVQFLDESTGYEQYAFGAAGPDDAAVVTAVAGQTLTVDDVLLQGGGGSAGPAVVTGRVTDAATGAALAGMCPYVAFAGDPAPQLGSCAEAGITPSDADGAFSSETGSGDWTLWLVDPTGTYAAASAPVSAVEGETVTQDVAMQRAGALTGRVVDARTRAPLAGLCPQAYAGRSQDLVGVATCSDAAGRWEVRGLPPGPVTLQVFGDTTHVDQWFPGVDEQAVARVVTVASGVAADLGTVRMPEGATLTGRVTDRRGLPVDGAWVVVGAFNSRAGAGEGRWTARTGADGRYSIGNVGLGERFATVYVPGQPYGWAFSGPVADPQRDPLRLRSGRTTRFDAVLGPEARLEVTVRGASPGVFTMIDATTPTGVPVGWSGDVLENGTAAVTELPTGRVRLKVTVDEGRTELWYAGGTRLTADVTQAATVAVRSGRTTAVTVDLPAAG